MSDDNEIQDGSGGRVNTNSAMCVQPLFEKVSTLGILRRRKRKRVGIETSRHRPANTAACIQRAIVAGWPLLYDLARELRATSIPVVLVVGDEDERTLDVNFWMKRLMPRARLAIVAGNGSCREPGGTRTFHRAR